MINVGEIVTDFDFAQRFTILRSTGSFVKGVWTEGTPTNIKMYGTIITENEKELMQMPEGDRIKGGIVIYTRCLIYTTHDASGTGRGAITKGISDKVLWNREYWKVSSVGHYGDYGYYKASCQRIKGD